MDKVSLDDKNPAFVRFGRMTIRHVRRFSVLASAKHGGGRFSFAAFCQDVKAHPPVPFVLGRQNRDRNEAVPNGGFSSCRIDSPQGKKNCLQSYLRNVRLRRWPKRTSPSRYTSPPVATRKRLHNFGGLWEAKAVSTRIDVCNPMRSSSYHISQRPR